MDYKSNDYAVAYLDKDGEGFSKTEPFIVDCISLHSCNEYVKEMKSEGYPKVIPFKYGKRLESYSWNYVMQHKIEFDEVTNYKQSSGF